MIVAISDAPTTCGVEAFARLSAWAAGEEARTAVLRRGLSPIAADIGAHDALVLNLPVVAWKSMLAEPILAAARARARGARVTLVLHEWADLNWKRRVSYLPLLPLATGIVFSAPEIERQFRASHAAMLATTTMALAPVPPNLFRPPEIRESALSTRLAAERAKGRFVLGQFGSIYPKKQSTIVLDVAAELIARGEDVFVAFIGSFIKGEEALREAFHRRVADLGLTDRVAISGYVETDAEVFGLFDQIDAFLYAFSEGLTSRRGSVLAAAMSGKPVIVNAPREPGGFDHHPTYRRLLEAGAVRLAPTEADARVLADAVVQARAVPPKPVAVEKSAVWTDVVEVIARVSARA